MAYTLPHTWACFQPMVPDPGCELSTTVSLGVFRGPALRGTLGSWDSNFGPWVPEQYALTSRPSRASAVLAVLATGSSRLVSNGSWMVRNRRVNNLQRRGNFREGIILRGSFREDQWRNFRGCDQQLHCKFRCRQVLRIQKCAAVYQPEGRYKDVFVCNTQWLCDWDALECRVAQDFESAHQGITGSFRIPGGGEILPFRNYPRRNCPLAKLPPPPPPVHHCQWSLEANHAA